MPPVFRIEIITKIARNQALHNVDAALSKYGGWIIQHQLFSNKAATLLVELPADAFKGFLGQLHQAGLNPTILQHPTIKQGEDYRGFIIFTFIHDDPDLKRTVIADG